MLEQAIVDVQLIEQSIGGNSLSDLRIRLALRACLSELRGIVNGREGRDSGELPSVAAKPRH